MCIVWDISRVNVGIIYANRGMSFFFLQNCNKDIISIKFWTGNSINFRKKRDIRNTFAATIVLINESIYIFAGVVGIILILSTKYLNLIKIEFLKSELISVKETYFSLASYYFCYLFSIIWAMFFPNLSILLVGGAGLLAIKIYIRRIAEKVYAEKKGCS